MMNRMQQGMDRLQDRLASVMGSSFTYTRSGVTRRLTGIVGKFLFAVDPEENGGQLYSHSRDFIVRRDLMDSAGYGTPKTGDRITETDDTGARRIYEVMAPNNEQPWRWSDDYHHAFRIHTRIVTSENP